LEISEPVLWAPTKNLEPVGGATDMRFDDAGNLPSL